MRTMSMVLAAAVFMSTASPAFSQQMSQADKDECMLASKNCVNQVDDIYKRIHRIDKEIKKGQKVYTPAELKKLQQKLAETQELLQSMEKPGR